MAAAKYRAENLCAILDWNGVQLDGTTEEIMPMGDTEAKFRSFGWHTILCDGHDIAALTEALAEARTVRGQPTILLARTIKGKGVSFMENSPAWHGAAPNGEQYEQAMKDLDAHLAELEG